MADELQEKLTGRLRYLLSNEALNDQGKVLRKGVLDTARAAGESYKEDRLSAADVGNTKIDHGALDAEAAKKVAESKVETRRKFVTDAIAGYEGKEVIPSPDNVFKEGTSQAVGGLIGGGGLGGMVGGFMDGVRTAMTSFIMEIPFVGGMIRTVSKLAQNLFNGKGFDWSKASEEAESEHKAGKMADALVKSGAIPESSKAQVMQLLLDEKTGTMTQEQLERNLKTAPAPVVVAPTVVEKDAAALAKEAPPPEVKPAAPAEQRPAESEALPADGSKGTCSTQPCDPDTKVAVLGTKYRAGDFNAVPVNGAGSGGVGNVPPVQGLSDGPQLG